MLGWLALHAGARYQIIIFLERISRVLSSLTHAGRMCGDVLAGVL